MRIPARLCALAAILATGGIASAQQPLDPYDSGGVVAPAPPVAPALPVAPAPPVAAPQPLNPYPTYPPPPAFGYQAPGGQTLPPQVPAYQQGYYLYPTQAYPYPYYYPAPRAPYCGDLCARRRVVKRWDGVRRFSLGVHFTALGVNQTVGRDDVTLTGPGLQMRMRSKGHFGFELSQSFLHAEFWNGGFKRDSFPFSASLMLYLLPNSDARHFNIYGLAGVGVMPDSVELNLGQAGSPGSLHASQDFTEYEAHAGVGAELRFHWFAIEADARALALGRDDSKTPAAYYTGVAGGPIPASSSAWQATLLASIWF